MFLIPFALGRNSYSFRHAAHSPQRYGPTGNTGPTYAHQLSDWLLKSAAGNKKIGAAKQLLQKMQNEQNAKRRHQRKRRYNFFLKHHGQ